MFRYNPVYNPPAVTPDYSFNDNDLLNEKKYIEAKLNSKVYTKEQRKAALLRLTHINDLTKSDSRLKEKEYQDDFNAWLRGKGKHSDHVKTPWDRTPLLTLPGVAEFLEKGYHQKWNLLTELAILDIRKVTDIKSAEAYFRYIIRGKESGLMELLNRYSVIQQDDRDRLAIGDGLVEKINTLQPGEKYISTTKRLANDLQDYLEFEETLDRDERAIFRNKLKRKDALISKLAMNIDVEDIEGLIARYEQRTEDYKSLYSGAMQALSTLNERKKNALNNQKQLILTGKYNKATKDMMVQEIARLERNILKTQEEASKWRVKLENDLDNVIPSVVTYAVDEGSELDKNWLYQESLLAWRELIDVTKKLVAMLKRITPDKMNSLDIEFLEKIYTILDKIAIRLNILSSASWDEKDLSIVSWEASTTDYGADMKSAGIASLVRVMKELGQVIVNNSNSLPRLHDSLLQRSKEIVEETTTILNSWLNGGRAAES